MKIKDIEISGKVIAAPMAGITDRSYRRILYSKGAKLSFTEMISCSGINYKNKNTLSTYRARLIDHGYIKAVQYGEVKFCLPYTKEFLLQEMKFG